MALNVTTAAIASGANTAIAQPSLAQWDQGQILKIEGVELPESYQVEFSGGGTVRTVPMIGTAEGVQIPNKLLQSSHPITAHVVLHESTTDRETEYWITIYVKPRQAPETVEIDPADISIIDQTIAAAQQAVATSTAQAEAAAGSAEDAAASAEAAAASETAASGSASSAASSERSAGASAVEADQAKTAAETAQAAAEAAQAAAEQAVTDAQAAGSQAVEAIDEAKTAGIQAIDAEAATQINQVGRAGATQIRQINELASNQMRSIETKTTQSIGAIEDARDAAIDDVQTEGQTQTAAAQEQAQAAAGSASAAANSASAAAGSASAAATARTGAETAAASVSASAAQIAQNASDIADLNRQISESITPAIEEIETALDGKAPVIINTASGEIASFADGADDMPMMSVVATIVPKQNLNGYDHPWVGGAEKNKCPPKFTSKTADGLTFTVSGEIFTVNGTATALFDYSTPNFSIPAGTYILNGCTGGSSSTYRLNIYGNSTLLAQSIDGDSAQFTVASGDVLTFHFYVNNGTTVTNLVVKPMIRLASVSDSTYEPYENICPISGHTGASVTRTGKNLSPYTGLNPVGGSPSTFFFLKKGTYTFSTDTGNVIGSSSGGYSNIYIQLRDFDNNNITEGNISGSNWYLNSSKMFYYGYGGGVVSSATFTLNTNCMFSYGFNNVLPDNVNVMQLEVGSTATAFEPYTGNQISITFPTEAGTVYGGTLDVTNGVLTVTHAFDTITGSNSFDNLGAFNTRTAYRTTLTNTYTEDASGINGVKSNGIPPKPQIEDNTYTGKSFRLATYNANTIFIFVETAQISSVAKLQTYLNANPLQVVYPLATPITYQLTPQELDRLLGTNNIWCDTGDTEVTYPADTKLYIDNKITQAIANALNA